VKIRSITAPNPGPFTLDGTRTWLLGDTTVIDPGPPIDAHVQSIIASMPQVELILITHRHADHAPAAVPLKNATRARILAPRGVLEDAQVDQRLSGGEIIEIEGTSLEVIPTPGHTQEHVCFLTADGDLFTGDTILGFGSTAIFPPDGSMRDYLRSLRLLRSRNPRRIHPAHGPTRDDAVALIDEYIGHRLDREQQIIDAIQGGATTIPEMRERIYPDLDGRLRSAAEIQITAHLIKLAEEGRVREVNGKYEVVQAMT
jgi:glyoxylase-like metal-dependent hydrolase (beta-lactamase superfamily II)